MEKIKCGMCGKHITDKTEVEYSEWYTEFFCNPIHAVTYYMDQAQSRPLEFDDDSLKRIGVKLENGLFYTK
ncbi:hypothetical protein [Bacillus pumilus]|uniref:hypothetical protein n=1 Tax=Bacillus pumilus TaxID=1408 RepID=UPI001C20FE66|nr:hypothetical protein [Bacillus pumilus]MBU8607800.1 hypothetical protein [Bacillus pumilus]MCY7500123.1 hypothetical protein [Bacillus pumilus]MCY7528553.1 hypothetical protein [Bacillus pumilus]MED4439488.1 hypothetical protein [Bacillus pumilus]MED4489931.1 hypothetical protein [Bacillus pumilus]